MDLHLDTRLQAPLPPAPPLRSSRPPFCRVPSSSQLSPYPTGLVPSLYTRTPRPWCCILFSPCTERGAPAPAQSGHTTTVDALWAGTPVLVWPGETMVSRAAAGIALAAGLRWAVARGGRDYAMLAARLVRAEGARWARAEVRAARASGGPALFDLKGWVRRWERALRAAADAAASPPAPGALGRTAEQARERLARLHLVIAP